MWRVIETTDGRWIGQAIERPVPGARIPLGPEASMVPDRVLARGALLVAQSANYVMVCEGG